MPEKSSKRPLYTVACRCGAKVTLEASAFGRPQPCASCGSLVTVMWGLDPMGRERMPVATVQPPPAKKKGAGRSPFTAFCGCGYTRPVPPEEAEMTPPCPGCGKLMVVHKAPDPKELQRLYKAQKSKSAAPPVTPRPKPPNRVVVEHDAQFFECPCGEKLIILKDTPGKPIECTACDRHHIVERLEAPAPAPPPASPATRKTGRRGAASPPRTPSRPPPPKPPRPLAMGEFLCKCGAIQPPRTSRTGREFTCAACGRRGHIEMVPDPKTQDMVLKVFVTSEPASPGPE